MNAACCLLFLLLLAATPAVANEQFNKMPPAEHMERAKRVIKRFDARAAKLHLEAIPASAPEYKEAKKLLATLPDLKKKQAMEAAKAADLKRKSDIIAQKVATASRKTFAKNYELSLLDQGLDAHVAAVGKSCTTLRVKWILVNRPLVHQLCNNADFINRLRISGFKKLVMADGYQYSWTVDL